VEGRSHFLHSWQETRSTATEETESTIEKNVTDADGGQGELGRPLPPAQGALCPICGSPPIRSDGLSGSDRLHGVPGTFSVLVCASCGAGWTLPPATSAELASFYPVESYGYLLERGVVGAVQQLVQKLFFRHALTRPPLQNLSGQPGLLLDVGCGRGDLGAALVKRGWRVAGVDPSAEACAFARARGVEATAGTLQSVSYDDESFDVVVMRHSLEHVPQPRADLALVYRLLRPGGLLLISVPNFASWERKRFGSSWFHLDLPRHRTHFVPGALRLALSGAGFELVSLESSGDVGSLLATLQYRFADRLLWTSAPAFWARYALGLLISPIMRLLDRTRGGGAVLDAVARRPPTAASPWADAR
jgi:SAM-dependent methyltransferase